MKKGKKAAIAIILAVAVAFFGYLAYAWDAGSISYPYPYQGTLVTIADLSTRYAGLTTPKWIPSGVTMTAAYDGPDAIITYSDSGVTDYQLAGVVIEIANGSDPAPTASEMNNAIAGNGGSVIIMGTMPVAVFPNAFNGSPESNGLFPTIPYCFFF